MQGCHLEPTILIVDDDPEMTTCMADLFRRASFAVTTASSMPEAVARLGERRFDVVVSDYNLNAAQNGGDLLAWVAANHADSGRIICSAAHPPGNIQAHAFVDKGAPATLLKTVRALSRPQRRNST